MLMAYLCIIDPTQWGQKFKYCNDSHDQSPIDIVTKDTVYDPILSDPVLHGGWQNVPTSVLMLQNTGHTSMFKLVCFL